MVVTQIVPLTTSRSKIFIDEEFAFVLYKGELRSYHIKENESVSEETVEEILHTVLPKRAKLRCMNLLQTKDYTQWQMERKLSEGYYPKPVIEEAIAYVKSYHYIDDYRYCTQYIEYQTESRSRQRIMMDLQKKGIDKETIMQAYEELSESLSPVAEEALIQKYLQKKKYDPKTADYQQRNKIYAFLARKGFEQEQIRKALDIT